jgi:hypothetical protein
VIEERGTFLFPAAIAATRKKKALRHRRRASGSGRLEWDAFAAVAEDLDTLFVGPIVNDVAEEVSVGSGEDAFEKAAFDDAAADSQACGLQVLLRPFNDQ